MTESILAIRCETQKYPTGTFVYLQSLQLFRFTSFNHILYTHKTAYMIYIICKFFNTFGNHITFENIKFNLPNVVNLTSWTTGQFLVMSRKVISHLYSPSSEVLIFSILNLASEVSDSICSWPLRKKIKWNFVNIVIDKSLFVTLR